MVYELHSLRPLVIIFDMEYHIITLKLLPTFYANVFTHTHTHTHTHFHYTDTSEVDKVDVIYFHTPFQ